MVKLGNLHSTSSLFPSLYFTFPTLSPGLNHCWMYILFTFISILTPDRLLFVCFYIRGEGLQIQCVMVTLIPREISVSTVPQCIFILQPSFMVSFLIKTLSDCCSVAQSCPVFATPWTAAHVFPVLQCLSLLRLMSIESLMPSNHLILCRPLLLLHSIFPSIRVFSNKLALPVNWPKYWSFSFSISSSNEYSGLSSFRMDWLDLLAVQGTLKSLLQQHSLKASVL